MGFRIERTPLQGKTFFVDGGLGGYGFGWESTRVRCDSSVLGSGPMRFAMRAMYYGCGGLIFSVVLCGPVADHIAAPRNCGIQVFWGRRLARIFRAGVVVCSAGRCLRTLENRPVRFSLADVGGEQWNRSREGGRGACGRGVRFGRDSNRPRAISRVQPQVCCAALYLCFFPWWRLGGWGRDQRGGGSPPRPAWLARSSPWAQFRWANLT